MTGTVIRIIGAVLDMEFPADSIPAIHNLVYVVDPEHNRRVPCEVAQHLPNAVRCVSLEATEGLARGLLVEDTGAPIKVPVGPGLLSRTLNVLGKPIDGKGEVNAAEYLPIHRDPPPFTQQRPITEIFETGIKVIDLLAPLCQGR